MSEDKSVTERYYGYQTEIEEKYGVKSVILIMVGSFYEMYQYKTNGRAMEISDLLNITLTKKDKKKELSKTNPYMCGFPSHSLRKFVDILVRQYEYTVGIVDQYETDEKLSVSKLKHRRLSRVYSPCIPYEYEFDRGEMELDNVETNVVMLFAVQKQRKNHLSKDQRYFLSYIILNLSFGYLCFDEEDYATIEDVYDSLNRLSVKENICERIIVDTNILDEKFLQPMMTHYCEVLDGKYKTLVYQQKVLTKIYTTSTERNVISDIDLERHPFIVQYLVYLFDFVYDHCPLVLSKIQRPIQRISRLNLSYNIRTYYELNILNQKNMDKRKNSIDKSLIDIMDRTMTTMGSRYLRHLFFVPIYDVDVLQRRYDCVSWYVQRPSILSRRRMHFKNFCDVERKFRQMCLNRISPYEMSVMMKNFETILQHRLVKEEEMTMVQRILDHIKNVWNLERMESSKSMLRIEDDFFVHPDENIIEFMRIIKNDEEILNEFVRRTENLCQVKITPSTDEITLVTTKRKWGLWKKTLESENVHIVEMKSSCTIHSPILDTACKRIQSLKTETRQHWFRQFSADIQRIVELFSNEFESICKVIREDDVFMTFAHLSIHHKYVRPIIKEDVCGYMECQDIRHPIIEQIQEDEVFTTNNVVLSNEKFGMLVYGLNSAGKSTLLKSIGLSVIMAQIGMFVPASKFEFSSYSNLLTKIYTMDNIYKGQSTFLYELNELKHILLQCNEQSLVLCDELTSGTETFSATGLMASTLLYCIENKSRFVFTTHLHTLSNIPEIIKNPQMDIVHFGVSVKDGKIIYNRKLESGMGNSLYGIEIASAVGFPPSFIKKAFDVRTKIAGKKNELASNRRSRYNKNVIVETCENCGNQDNLHTHHIEPQKDADEYGMIDHFHKNKKHNLQILCRDCHIETHN